MDRFPAHNDTYATAAEGLTRVDFPLIDDALKSATARAKRLMEQFVNISNNQLQRKLRLYARNGPPPSRQSQRHTQFGKSGRQQKIGSKGQRDPAVFAVSGNNFADREWSRTRDARLKRILWNHPYNITATKELERSMRKNCSTTSTLGLKRETNGLRPSRRKVVPADP